MKDDGMFKLRNIIKRVMMGSLCLLTSMMDQGMSKVLKCPQVGILNIALADKLYIIARIKLAFKESSAVVQLLAADGAKKADLKDQKSEIAFIKTQLERIISPVKEFFTEIREFSALIEPLLKESIDIKPEQSHLYAFMQSEEDLLPFFEKRIQTHEQLKVFALEFKMLFGDLHDSLSLDVIRKYEKFVADVKGKKLQGVVKNKN